MDIMAARIGRPQERAISLTDGERDELERIARSRSASHGLVRRTKIILASADGEANTSIARRLGIANPTVCHWRNKWSLLVDAQHDGAIGRIEVEADDVPDLVDEQRISRELEALRRALSR